MSSDLREAYDTIADDYLRKKRNTWKTLIEFVEGMNVEGECIMDVGCANGRNLNAVRANFAIGIDLSRSLLKGFVGPTHTELVQAALPSLPIRRDCVDIVLLIAVIHHLETRAERFTSLVDIRRILLGNVILSVWRKWRSGVREGIFSKIRSGEGHEDLVNVRRPWKNSRGDIIARRFYHYFTYKELSELVIESGLIIKRKLILGGRNNDDNFFCVLSK